MTCSNGETLPHFCHHMLTNRYYRRSEYPQKISQLTEYYKFHEDVPRIYMEPMSSTVHMYYDFKRRLTYLRVTQMLDNQRQLQRAQNRQEAQNSGETATRVRRQADLRASDEHEKTCKNKSGEKSKHVVIVEENQDLLDFDCDADFEDFGVRKQKRIYLNKSLKKVLPESLIYSLMNWKKKDERSLVNVTRAKINSNRKYVDFNQDSQFFLRDCFANDWDTQSEILTNVHRNKGSNLKTLPYEYIRRLDDTKSETLMDLNAILSSQREKRPPDGNSFQCIESFMVERNEVDQLPQFIEEDQREQMKVNMKRKKQVKWEEIVKSSKKDFKAEESFYKQLKLKDIEKLMKRTQTRESNRRLGEALMDKIKNKKIYDQLKSYSNKILRDKGLLTKKFNMAKKKGSVRSPKQTRTNTLKSLKLGEQISTKNTHDTEKWKLKKSTLDNRAAVREKTSGKQNQSLSKKPPRKRLKGKRTNSEAINNLIAQSQLKSRGKTSKVAISEVLSEAKKKMRVHTNSNMRRKKSKKKLIPSEFEMLMTAGNNKLAPRRDQLRLSKHEVNKLILRKRTTENLFMEELGGRGGTIETKKKSLRLAQEMRGIYESLAESGLASVDVRFKSTKKKLTRGDFEFEFNLKKLSNAEKKQVKGTKSPVKRRKKGSLQRQFNVKLRQKSKENDLRIKKALSSMRKLKLEMANEVGGQKKLKLSSNMLKSAKMDAKFGLKDQLNFFDRKSINCRSQKGISRKKDLFGEKATHAKSREKGHRRRQSEKNILNRKENAFVNGQKRVNAGKSFGILRKKSKPREEVEMGKMGLLEREQSKSKKSRRKRKKEEDRSDLPKKEMWGLGKKKRAHASKTREADKRSKNRAKREKLDTEIFRKLGNKKFQSLLKSQRKGQVGMVMLVESLAEKTLNSGLNRKNSKKLLGKLNYEILSKKKSRKQNIKSQSKVYKKDILRTKNEDCVIFFENKSKSMKKKREMTMQ